MAQYDFGTINTSLTSGGDLATLLQNWRDAVLSNHSGTSRPTYVKAGQIWFNTATPTNWAIMFYDGADDILMGYVNTTDNSANFLHRADVTTKTASATIALTERNMTVGVTASTANLTMTLPAATNAKNGFKITIQKRDNTAFTVGINRTGSDLINGATGVTLTQQYDTVELVCDGVSAWYAYGGVLDLGITTPKIANSAVTTQKIADQAVTSDKLAASVASLLIPPGGIIQFGGISAPTGWLLCFGQAVSRTTYAALYAGLGGAQSPHGQGDGSTTFNVPDYRGRVPAGFDLMGGVSANRLPATRSIAVASISQSSTTVTVTTSGAHSLDPGSVITIAGAGNTAFNGTWTVSSVLRSGTEVNRASQVFYFTRAVSVSIAAVAGGTITTPLTGAVDGSVLGATGGSASHVLTTGEMPAHNHGFTYSRNSPSGGSGDTADFNHGPGASYFSSTTGGNGPHNIVQPTIITNYIIKT
jgi:microcystin-dependent protein